MRDSYQESHQDISALKPLAMQLYHQQLCQEIQKAAYDWTP